MIIRLRRSIARRPLRGRARRDGSSAVEFAMVAFPFFFMMFAIMELGLVFITDSVLENATLEAGRLVRTGQAATGNMSAAKFKTELCDRMSIFKNDCPARATVDVREVPQFRNSPPDPLANGSSFDTSGLGYKIGEPGSLILVRTWYAQPLFTPFLKQALSKLGDGNTIMIATTAFRNEPYAQVTPAPPP